MYAAVVMGFYDQSLHHLLTEQIHLDQEYSINDGKQPTTSNRCDEQVPYSRVHQRSVQVQLAGGAERFEPAILPSQPSVPLPLTDR